MANSIVVLLETCCHVTKTVPLILLPCILADIKFFMQMIHAVLRMFTGHSSLLFLIFYLPKAACLL